MTTLKRCTLTNFKIHEVKTDRNNKRKDKSTIIIGDFSFPISVIGRTSTQKMTKEIED